MEAVGLAASIVGIATLAYDSSKKLYEVINGIRNAPKTLQDVHADLDTLQQLLKAIVATLEQTADATFSDGARKCLEEVEPSMLACSKICDEFAAKLTKISSHSDANHKSLRDAIKLQFQDKDILSFKYRLGSYKATLNIALALASLRSTKENQGAVTQLETEIVATMGSISGQIQGLEMGMQSISDFGAQKEELTKSIEEQKVALGNCLKVCISASQETAKKSGSIIKNATAYDEARQLVGTIGNVSSDTQGSTIDMAVARDRARQMVGSIEGNIALEFMK